MSGMDQMAVSHQRDYAAKQAMEDARRAIDALLALEHNRVFPSLAEKLQAASDALKDQCDHIVRVWD